MNQTIDLINAHRSIRRFTKQSIAIDDLHAIIESGQAAATSSFCQSVSVIRVVDPSKRTQIANWAGEQKYVDSAAEFLVFCADLARANALIDRLDSSVSPDTAQEGANSEGRFNWTEQFLTATLDTGLFAQNCVIAAQSIGLGVCYIGGIRNEIEKVADLLELPKLVAPLFGLCLGYPDQAPQPKPRLPLDSVLFEDSYVASGSYLDSIESYDARIKQYYEQRTAGKLSQTWSQQLANQARSQTRPQIRTFLQTKGFAQR